MEKSSGTLYWRAITGDVVSETDTSGNSKNEYIYFAGQRVAWWDSLGNSYYIQSDALGTTRTITKSNGTVCYDADFTPYGQEIQHTSNCPSTYNYKFTGYERDSETQLDYAFARYYNSRLGRLMSADPLMGSSGDPQTLNRYAYVGNSPTNFADPSGTHKCNAPQGQSIPAPCDGGGYGDGSDDGWGLDSGAEFDFYWGKLTSYSESGGYYTSWDYMAFWGYGGISYNPVGTSGTSCDSINGSGGTLPLNTPGDPSGTTRANFDANGVLNGVSVMTGSQPTYGTLGGYPSIIDPNTRVALQWSNGPLPGSLTIGFSNPLSVNAGANSNPFWSASVSSVSFNGAFTATGSAYVLGMPVGSGPIDNALNNNLQTVLKFTDIANWLATHHINCNDLAAAGLI